MSTEARPRARTAEAADVRVAPCRTLREYIRELVDRLDAADPAAGYRLREVTGDRIARITLDDEAVDVRFEGRRLVISRPARQRVPDGTGATDRQTTLELLAGRREVTEAILEGLIDVRGETEDVLSMFLAIEIILDTAARAPALQALARDYENDPCRTVTSRVSRTVVFGPTEHPAEEIALLQRLDLLR